MSHNRIATSAKFLEIQEVFFIYHFVSLLQPIINGNYLKINKIVQKVRQLNIFLQRINYAKAKNSARR